MFTDDVDVGVCEDGPVLVGGLALVDGSVSKVNILQDQGAAGCQGPSGLRVSCC